MYLYIIYLYIFKEGRKQSVNNKSNLMKYADNKNLDRILCCATCY